MENLVVLKHKKIYHIFKKDELKIEDGFVAGGAICWRENTRIIPIHEKLPSNKKILSEWFDLYKKMHELGNGNICKMLQSNFCRSCIDEMVKRFDVKITIEEKE